MTQPIDRNLLIIGGAFNPSDTSYVIDLATAVSQIGSDQKTLIVDGPITIDSAITIPSNITFKMTNRESLITKSGSATLTINGPFEAGIWQIFNGFDSGDVTFGNGVVREIYPEWWGIDGTNDEDEVNKAIQATPTTGGVVQLLNKTYNFQTNTVTMKSGVIVRGLSSGLRGDAVEGTQISTTLTSKAAFTSGSDTWYVGLEYMVIKSSSLTSNRNGIECLGTVTAGNSYGFDINHVAFLRLDKGLYVNSTDGSAWQYSQISISRCRSDEGNQAVHMNSGNAELRSTFNYFNALDKVFNIVDSSMVMLDQTFGGLASATGLGAFVYAEGPSALKIQNSQAEQLTYFLYMPATGAAAYIPIAIENCAVNAPIVVLGQRAIISKGNLYNGGANELTDALFISIGDYIADGTEGGGFIASSWTINSAFATFLASAKGSQQPDGYIHQTVGADVASGATIAPSGSVFHVTGTSAISTISLPWPGFAGKITIIPDGAFTWTAAGNIATAGAAAVNQAITFIYDNVESKWFLIDKEDIINLTSFTPTWTASANPDIGNGTLAGFYKKRGKTVTVFINLVAGSGTTFGTGVWTFGNLPYANNGSIQAIGSALMYDSDPGAAYPGVCQVDLSASTLNVGATGSAPWIASGSPFTWAESDILRVTVSYETA